MSTVDTRTCQVCGGAITADQIARREAGLLKGVLHCPTCVQAKRQAAAAAQAAGGGQASGAGQAVSGSGVVTAAPRATAVAEEPITLEEGESGGEGGEASAAPSGKIRSFATTSSLGGAHKDEGRFKRPIAGPTEAATRCRTFHSKLAAPAIAYMDDQINEWIDSQAGLYIKTVSSTVGIFEGKHAEPHLIVTIFY